jgi:transmembrane sensor
MRSIPAPPDKILEEAAEWIARLHADDRTAKDEADFKAWMATSPQNAVAFEVMDRSWTALAGASPRVQKSTYRVSRRQLVMASLGGGLVLSTSFFALRRAEAQTYETKIGEQKHVSLTDGSKIFLNASTKLTISISDAERNASLIYGRANFDIAADAKRPFVVSAGDRQIVSHGSRFDVGSNGDQVQIVLTQGAAYFQNMGGAASSGKALGAGDRLLFNGTSVRIDRPRIAPLVAWQSGTAIFDDSLLSDAVREMNLYSQTKLEIVDARAGRLHVSGIYRVGDNAAFARSIAKFLPVRFSQQGDRVILRSAVSSD